MIVNSVREIKSIRPLAPLLLTIKGRGEGRRNKRPSGSLWGRSGGKLLNTLIMPSRESWLQLGFVEALIKPSFIAVPASSGETGRKTTGWARLGAQPQISKLQQDALSQAGGSVFFWMPWRQDPGGSLPFRLVITFRLEASVCMCVSMWAMPKSNDGCKLWELCKCWLVCGVLTHLKVKLDHKV